MTGKKTEKQNVFNSFLYTDDDPGLVHVWTIFFLPFFFSFSFSGHTNNHRVYIPPPDSFIIILIINKKEKKQIIMWTASSLSSASPSSVRSSFGIIEIKSFLHLLAACESRSLTEEPSHLARCF